MKLFDESACLRRSRPSGWLVPVHLAAPRRSVPDTSVLLAACGSAQGSSKALFDYASVQRWDLLASPWVLHETVRIPPKLPPAATGEWSRLRPHLIIVDDVLSLDRPLVFPVSKDKPVLLSALASANVLLTLDRVDFIGLLGRQFYGLPLMAPSEFLENERALGRLR